MRNIALFSFLIMFAITSFAQSDSWRDCEFPTYMALDTFDTNTEDFNCNRVYIEATSEHYYWNGSSWLESESGSDSISIYSSNDTITADRTLEGNANSLFFTGLDSMYIEGTNIELDASNNLTFFAENTIEFELDATDGKGIYLAIDGNVGIGTSAPDAKLDVEGGSVQFADYGVATYLDTAATATPADVTYSLGVDNAGNIIEVNNAKSSKIFYPPALVIDVSTTGNARTLDLHQEYVDLYGSPAIASSGAPSAIPTYAQDELFYYVTDYDNTIFSDLSISADGVLTYDVDTVPTDNCAFLNVVFVVK